MGRFPNFREVFRDRFGKKHDPSPAKPSPIKSGNIILRDDLAKYSKTAFAPGYVNLITENRENEGMDRRTLRPEKSDELRNSDKGKIHGTAEELYVPGTHLDRDPDKLIKIIEDANQKREKRLDVFRALHELQLLQGVPKKNLYRPPQHVIDELNL